jgi:ribosomal protein L37E
VVTVNASSVSAREVLGFVALGALSAIGATVAALAVSEPAARILSSAALAGLALGAFSGAARLARKRRHAVDSARAALESFCAACGRDSALSKPFCAHCAFPSHRRSASWVEEGADERGGLVAYVLGLVLAVGGWAMMGFADTSGALAWLVVVIGFVVGALGVFMIGSMLVQFVTRLRARRVFAFRDHASTDGARFEVESRATFADATLISASGTSRGAGVAVLATDPLTREELAALTPRAVLFVRALAALFAMGQLDLYPARTQRWSRSGSDEDATLELEITLEAQLVREHIPPPGCLDAVTALRPWLPETAFQRSSVAALWKDLAARADADLVLRRFLSLLPEHALPPENDRASAPLEAALARSIAPQPAT